jgi:penicillin-binding protein 1A
MKPPLRTAILAVLAGIILFPFLYFSYVYFLAYDVLGSLRIYEPSLATRLYDNNGTLISELYDEHRTVVDIASVPEHVREAFIATEDQNFYRHFGFDIRSIIRALVIDLASGEIRQGGSTITQQLVKRLYTRGEKTFQRKIIELLIAREFEKRYTKLQILEMYLNLIYFGHGAYGINSAARFYFECDARDLSVMQACVLASLTTAPNLHSPLRNPEETCDRSRQILFKLISAGVIGRGEAAGQFTAFWTGYLDALRTRYPTLSVRNRKNDHAPYFTEYVRKFLVKKFGAEAVYRGGLQVHTTLDLRCQEAAQEIMTKGIETQNKISASYNRNIFRDFDRNYARKYAAQNKAEKKSITALAGLYGALQSDLIDELGMLCSLFDLREMASPVQDFVDEYEWFRSSGKAEGALAALDPFTGGIVALVGGSGFHHGNQVNRAVQSRRQPGSAFKIFIYGAGISAGIITAATSFFDISTEDMEPEKDWHPKNYDKKSRGLVLVRKALALSLNVIAVRVYEKVGGDRIWRFASKLMGLPRERFQVDPTLALGTSELTPLELTEGVAAIANGGFEVEPFAIRRVTDRNGKVIYDPESERLKKGRKRVMSESTAFIMTDLLKEVVTTGTAYYAVRRVAGLRVPAAGKTGTNTAFRDAWFTGFTPHLAATVWVGCDIPRFSLGSHQSGAAVAAPLWGEFMRRILPFRKGRNFPGKPGDVTRRSICSITGNLPSGGCPRRDEFFTVDTVPRETCSGRHGDDDTI